MSQRLFSLVWIAVIWVLIAAGAFAAGVVFVLGGSFEETLLKLVVPIFGTFLGLRNWYKTLDAMVADHANDPTKGIAANNIIGLFAITPFYVMTAAAAAAAFTLFGLTFVTDATLTILIDGLVLVAQTLLESFGNRPPGSAVTTQALVAAQTVKAESEAYDRNRARGVDGRP